MIRELTGEQRKKAGWHVGYTLLLLILLLTIWHVPAFAMPPTAEDETRLIELAVMAIQAEKAKIRSHNAIERFCLEGTIVRAIREMKEIQQRMGGE